MTALLDCVQGGATTTGLVAWLNANAGAVTGIATAALALLTGIYVVLTKRTVVLTKRMADAAVDQAHAALEQTHLLAAAQAAVQHDRQRALLRHVRHLIGEVEPIPFPLREGQLMPRYIPWTDDELQDLRVLAAAVEGTDEREVSRAVRCLREMASQSARIHGAGTTALSERERFIWNENLQGALTALQALAGEPR
jgi:hypothetical protein